MHPLASPAQVDPATNGFRLTLTSGTPVTTADATGATTIYLSPFTGDRIALYDGTAWALLASAEIPVALGTLTNGIGYDVFAYNNSGVLAGEVLAWTNATARATALVRTNGVLLKTGALTRRYVGSFYATSTTATADAEGQRFLFNADNRVPRRLFKHDNTDSWTYATAAFRSWNNSTANRVEVFRGLDEEPLALTFNGHIGTAPTSNGGSIGIGIDSTTVSTADATGNFGNISFSTIATVAYGNLPGLGYHYAQMLEYGSTNTVTFLGDNGSTDRRVYSAIVGSCLA